MASQTLPPPTADSSFVQELGQLIIDTLGLDASAAEIDPTAPLYGDGLGLDSIDILEIAMVISKTYGVQLRADDADNHRIFSSLQHLADHVAALRAR